MSSNPDKDTDLAFDPELQTENIAFDPNEMIGCDGCGRANPPNRLNCIYCGSELDIPLGTSGSIKTNQRKLELWEHGFNVIAPPSSKTGQDLGKIAALLSMDPADVRMILDTGCPLPLARVESEKEASIISRGLSTLGVNCSTVSDDDLGGDKPPVRLSRIDNVEDRLVLKDFNTANLTEIAKADLAVIVPGILTLSKTDSLENKRRGGKSKLLSETTTSADESVIDIYTRNDANGFRVRMTGFDFSCLGEDKRLLAAENIRSLTDFLERQCPNAKLVNNYAVLKQALGVVWEVESRRDSKGVQRMGLRKTEFGAVATINNTSQFTKFSRLQWHLL